MTEQAAPPTVTMYRPNQDGSASPVEVPAAQVASVYRSGQAGFANDQKVFVKQGDQVVPLSGAEAGAYFKGVGGITGGAATETAFKKQEERKEYETVGNMVAAPAIGFARGATLGLSDALATGFGGRGTADYISKQKEYNPGLTTAGEVGGMIAPMLIPGVGEAGLAANVGKGALGVARAAEGVGLLARAGEVGATALRGIGAPIRAVDAVGGLAEAAVGKGLSSLGVLEGSVVSKTAQMTARGAAEGSLFSLGGAISDASLKGDELTSEKVMAALKHGAFIGGGVGGALGLVGGVLGKAGSKIADSSEGLLSKIVPESKIAAKQAEFLERAGVELPRSEAAIRALAEENGVRKAIQSTGANLPQTERLARMGEEVQKRVAQQVIDDLPTMLGKEAGKVISKAEKAEAAIRLESKWGQEIGGLTKEIDKAKIQPNMQSIREEALNKAVELEALPGRGNDANWFFSYAKTLEEHSGGANWSRLRELRTDLRKQIKENKFDPLNTAKQDMYSALSKELSEGGQKAAESLNSTEFAARWQQANQQYQAAAWLKEATAKGMNAENRNRTVGLSEMFGTLQGGSVLGSVGAAVAGPVGAAVGGVLGGLGGAVIKNTIRRYGDDYAARMYLGVARNDGLSKLTNALDTNVTSAITNYVKSVKAPSAAGGALQLASTYDVQHKKDLDKQYQLAQSKVQLAASNPAAIGTRLSDIRQTNAPLADAVQAKVVTAAKFLESKLPTRSPDPMQPDINKSTISDAEKAKFLRYARTVESPEAAIKSLQQGKLSREEVEAMKAVYPAFYKQIQDHVQAEVESLKKPLPYAKALQLGTLLDIPTTSALKPKNLAGIQASFQAAAPVEPQHPTASLKGPIAKSKNLSSFSATIGEEK